MPSDAEASLTGLQNQHGTFLSKLDTIRQDSLKYLYKHLGAPMDWKRPDIFKEVISFVVDLGISQTDIAKHLETNTGTVSRWASGDSRPPKYMRHVVLNEVRFLVGESLGIDEPEPIGELVASDVESAKKGAKVKKKAKAAAVSSGRSAA